MINCLSNNRLILLVFIVILTYLVWKLSNNIKIIGNKNTVENFEDEKDIIDNKKYNKYSETLIDEDGLNTEKLYKNYNGKLRGEKWENMTLDQCYDNCNQLEGCIGFSRENVLDDVENTCYPRTHMGRCHSIRKGSPEQRVNAVDYNTYIKSNVKNQLTRCIGDVQITMNRLVSIKSTAKPNHYVSIHNNDVVVKKFKIHGTNFIKNSQFKIVPGLEGSGTVSFMLTDDYNQNYYLSANDNNKLGIMQLSSNSKNNNFNNRAKVSFELLDGFSNKELLSIRKYSNVNDYKYLKITNTDNNMPRIDLVPMNKVENLSKISKTSKEMTFEIVDIITNTSILEPKSDKKQKENCCGSNNRKKQKAIARKLVNKREKFVNELDAEIALDHINNLDKDSIKRGKCSSDDNIHNKLGKSEKIIRNELKTELNEIMDDNINLDKQMVNLENKKLETLYKKELELWKNAVQKTSNQVIKKQQSLIERGIKVNDEKDKLNIQQLSNDYYFIRNKSA